MATKIMKCVCIHRGQDKLHGKGNRAHNLTKKGDESAPVYRCTVCSRAKSK